MNEEPVIKRENSKVVQYFKQHHIPATFECLIAGLVTVCPKDPLKWMIESFHQIEEKGVTNATWDMFIPENMKPRVKIVVESYLDDILTFGISTEPSDTMLTTAYEFFWTHLKRKCFRSFVMYCKWSKQQRKKLELKVFNAEKHNNKRIIKAYFRKWKNWSNHLVDIGLRRIKVFEEAYMKSVCKAMLQLWHKVAQDERRTREYFEKLERGEEEEEIDFDFGSKDASGKISKLPNKCIIRIFTHLSLMDLGRCAKVCRSWRVLAGSSTFWSSINFYRIRYHVSDSMILQFLLKYRAYLLQLNLRQCNQVTSRSLKAIAECRNLQDLNLSENPIINDHIMREIAENCYGLLYLNLSRCPITNATLRALARYSGNLLYLNIAYCTRCTNRGLQYFSYAHGCSKLVHLDLSGCSKFSAEGFSYIAQCCCNLQTLIINEIGNVDDDTMVCLAQCINLRSLSMLGSTLVTDAGYKAVAVNKKLQILRIESNRIITDYAFKFISRCCVLLRHLLGYYDCRIDKDDLRTSRQPGAYLPLCKGSTVRKITLNSEFQSGSLDCHMLTDAGLRRLSFLRHLVVLNLADSVRVTDIGVRHISDGYSATKIRELNLSNCFKISDVSMLRLSQKLQSLTHLSLCFCEHITDAGIELLAHLPVLSDVDLSGTNVTDRGLESLGEVPNLRFLIVSECSRISDIGIDKFAVQVKLLEGIDVSHCMDLTDQAIKTLAFCCRFLTNVSMAGCPQMTDLSIQYLSSVCRYLHVLNFSGCIRITDKGIAFLRKKCKQLRILSLLYCRNVTKYAARKAASMIEKVEYNDDPVPSWFNYSDFLIIDEDDSQL